MPKIPAHFKAAAVIERVRRATYLETVASLTKQLHSEQPSLMDGLELLGHWKVGDVRVDCYGTVKFVGSRFRDLYVEDIAIAGTKISLKECIGGREWERMEEEVRDQYLRSVTVMNDWRGRVLHRAA